MRASLFPLRHLVPALALAAAVPLEPAPARAQAPGWVDPPARTGARTGVETGAEAPAGARVEAPAGKPVVAPVRAEAPTTPAAGTSKGVGAAASGAPPRSPRRPRRLADTPASTPAATHAPALAPTRAAAPVATFAVGPGPAERADAARALAAEYLAAVSAPGAEMVGAAARFYGARVDFYGRPTTRADLIAEKRGFVRRWPDRRYAARAVGVRCTPDGEACTVRALVDFRAANPE